MLGAKGRRITSEKKIFGWVWESIQMLYKDINLRLSILCMIDACAARVTILYYNNSIKISCKEITYNLIISKKHF